MRQTGIVRALPVLLGVTQGSPFLTPGTPWTCLPPHRGHFKRAAAALRAVQARAGCGRPGGRLAGGLVQGAGAGQDGRGRRRAQDAGRVQVRCGMHVSACVRACVLERACACVRACHVYALHLSWRHPFDAQPCNGCKSAAACVRAVCFILPCACNGAVHAGAGWSKAWPSPGPPPLTLLPSPGSRHRLQDRGAAAAAADAAGRPHRGTQGPSLGLDDRGGGGPVYGG